ncbi:DUF445 domain-containing protein [Burkholderia sp. FERM BP-3421]|jgi:uncharacterized membrane-anchored protein YjiN (DUF445 family)|uniref:DUF445 domain-containing protein n=1 Tax=Burkholderia sp. FERM BP-3421 TaxID=1494466 RepID=UPI0023602305|nr:DUF445 domain-containing protein [Burkholderia sp. FERM BP-3421]WDD92976.1 DUF445 domain-containing protein [Burkholderia sp. FERM BP-3421]
MSDAKLHELNTSKRRALALLFAAAAVFVTMLCLPPGLWVDGAKAVAEAAMVGALADWFAVVALFRRVPIPFVSRHTAIIPNNKEKIADNLAAFVRDKFLDSASLIALLKRHDPAARFAQWLGAPEHTTLLGAYATKLFEFALDMTDDARIQSFVKDAFRAALDKVDLSQSMGAILGTLTRDGRHQALLDDAIAQLVRLLRDPDNRTAIAGYIVDWLKGEYPKAERLLPTNWLGEHGAELVANAVSRVLTQVADDPGHALRGHFDAAAARLVEKLRHDPAFIDKGEEIKRYLRDGEAFNSYAKALWTQLRAWLKADLAREDSTLRGRTAALGAWLGERLAASPSLRASTNEHIERAAGEMAPEFAAFLTRHISDTVRHWDDREMSRQIELNIGKDLQYIRINGTLVGGLVGLGLYVVSCLARWAGALPPPH